MTRRFILCFRLISAIMKEMLSFKYSRYLVDRGLNNKKNRPLAQTVGKILEEFACAKDKPK